MKKVTSFPVSVELQNSSTIASFQSSRTSKVYLSFGLLEIIEERPNVKAALTSDDCSNEIKWKLLNTPALAEIFERTDGGHVITLKPLLEGIKPTHKLKIVSLTEFDFESEEKEIHFFEFELSVEIEPLATRKAN